ncbi:MAG: aldolase [Hyphomicrobiales bacterium]|jgi:HPr kinase/phosphorylase
MIVLHAACCTLGGAGILVRGESGSGKSSLALLLASAPDGTFVADDRVVCAIEGGRLVARPHPALAGRVEVRGQGILSLADLGVTPSAETVLQLAVDLVAEAPRLPEPAEAALVLGVGLPRVILDAGVRSAGLAPLIIRSALRKAQP